MTKEEFNLLPDWKTGAQSANILYRYNTTSTIQRITNDSNETSIELIKAKFN